MNDDDNLDDNIKENILESNFDNLFQSNLESNRYTEINDEFPFNVTINKPSILYENVEDNNNNLQINKNNNINDNNNNKNDPNQKKDITNQKKIPKKIYMNQTNINNNKKKLKFKITFIGESSVGKTSIITRFLQNIFFENYECTIVAEEKKKILNLDNNNLAELQIWDTAGEERFRTITKQFYKDAYGAFVIYDITNKESFTKIEHWIKDINDSAPKDIVIGIVGNKNDIKNKRVVEYEEGENYSNKINALFFEVSAQNGNNVDAAFQQMAYKIYEKVQKGCFNDIIIRESSRESIKLNHKVNKKKKKPKCCKNH